MYLQRISIINYKNIREADLRFSSKINCFIGNNGVGKTNLLDAVYYLSFCKSHSNPVDSQVIKHDEEFFVLHGFYDGEQMAADVYCGLKRKQKKQFKRNKKEYEKLSDHIGFIPLVLVSPADSELILGGSDERRKFVDGFISQYDKNYLTALLAYNKALVQRNSMIRNGLSDDMLLDIWEEQLVLNGEYIFQKRNEFIREFLPIFQEFYKYVSQEKEQVKLSYHSQLHNGDSLRNLLLNSRERDRLTGYTTKGIHKDDLEMILEDFPIKRTGSQGQNKTYLIALKLAQFDFLKRINGTCPILLFDDIFDKLDAQRVRQIILLLKDNRFGQIFISDTNRESISEILKKSGCEHHIYIVNDGEVKLNEEL
jgi:DNA replication and repair protein RecF